MGLVELMGRMRSMKAPDGWADIVAQVRIALIGFEQVGFGRTGGMTRGQPRFLEARPQANVRDSSPRLQLYEYSVYLEQVGLGWIQLDSAGFTTKVDKCGQKRSKH